MEPSAACDDQRVLADRHRADVESYKHAVSVMGAAIGSADFDVAFELSERRREAYRKSREALELHIREHGCARGPVT